MRVIMPAFEKQAAAEGGMVDTLMPPVDPSRPRQTYSAKTGLSDPLANRNPSPLLGAGAGSLFGGFGASSGASTSSSSGSSGSQWDAPGFAPDPATQHNKQEEAKSAGSSWKFW